MVPETEAAQLQREDAALMRRIQASDEAALASLMQRWELPVKALIARIVLSTAEADDLAQETFVRLWQHRASFDPARPVKPWILGIAVNLARNRLRWWRRRPTVPLDLWSESTIENAATGARGAADLERAECARAVRDAVAALPVDLREALVLFEYEQMSHAEIASAVGATPKAVETRIARAREKLRTMLAKWVR